MLLFGAALLLAFFLLVRNFFRSVGRCVICRKRVYGSNCAYAKSIGVWEYRLHQDCAKSFHELRDPCNNYNIDPVIEIVGKRYCTNRNIGLQFQHLLQQETTEISTEEKFSLLMHTLDCPACSISQVIVELQRRHELIS